AASMMKQAGPRVGPPAYITRARSRHGPSGRVSTMLDIAIRAAREAGELLRANMGRRLEVSHKGPIDLVTEVDIASEKLIKSIISTYYPRHTVLGEEAGF